MTHNTARIASKINKMHECIGSKNVMSKRDGGPCSNCGGTVYYDKGGCVKCVGDRASKSQQERRQELERLRTENALMLDLFIECDSWLDGRLTAIKGGDHLHMRMKAVIANGVTSQ